jgi:Flp pilus assembly protein CpaB
VLDVLAVARPTWANEFSPDPRHRDGLQARCKECQRAALAAYRQAHPLAIRAAQERHDRKRRARGQDAAGKPSDAHGRRDRGSDG